MISRLSCQLRAWACSQGKHCFTWKEVLLNLSFTGDRPSPRATTYHDPTMVRILNEKKPRLTGRKMALWQKAQPAKHFFSCRFSTRAPNSQQSSFEYLVHWWTSNHYRNSYMLHWDPIIFKKMVSCMRRLREVCFLFPSNLPNQMVLGSVSQSLLNLSRARASPNFLIVWIVIYWS